MCRQMAAKYFQVSMIFFCSQCLIAFKEFAGLNQVKVECVNGTITFAFETEKPFTGRVYVRGLEDDAKCSKSFLDYDNENLTRFSLNIKRGHCGMDRQRVEDGVYHSVMVILAFHSVLETRDDLAFRGMCFFRSPQKTAGAMRGVAGSLSAMIENHVKVPTLPFTSDCTYSIHRENEDGPVVTYAKLGEKLYHVWECVITAMRKSKKQSKKKKDWGMLIHSCKVEDGRGFRYDLLDDIGCPWDDADTLSQLEYANTTAKNFPNVYRAVAQSLAYKFSRTTELRFKCVVAICDRRQGQCEDLAPPKCNGDRIGVEGNEKHTKIDGWKHSDVMTTMHVFDDFDDQVGEGAMPPSFFQQLRDSVGIRAARCVAAHCGD